MGALVSAGELKDPFLCLSLEWEPGPGFSAALLFLDCCSFVLQSLNSLISDCLNMPLGILEGLGGRSPFPTKEKWRTWEGFKYTGGPLRAPAQFQREVEQRLPGWGERVPTAALSPGSSKIVQPTVLGLLPGKPSLGHSRSPLHCDWQRPFT